VSDAPRGAIQDLLGQQKQRNPAPKRLSVWSPVGLPFGSSLQTKSLVIKNNGCKFREVMNSRRGEMDEKSCESTSHDSTRPGNFCGSLKKKVPTQQVTIGYHKFFQ
jgi:hypothetical protein